MSIFDTAEDNTVPRQYWSPSLTHIELFDSYLRLHCELSSTPFTISSLWLKGQGHRRALKSLLRQFPIGYCGSLSFPKSDWKLRIAYVAE